MRLRITSFALLIAMMSAFLIAPASSAAAKTSGIGPSPFRNIPLTGELKGATLNIDDFAAENGKVMAIGTVTSGTASIPFKTPVTVEQGSTSELSAKATCPILHLVLGPLDLNLLGLRVQLNQVVLDITAESGGGILGDLLCGVANLLNNPTGLAGLLNQILDLLGGILRAPATGTVTGALLNVTSFSAQNGKLVAAGNISDTQGKALASAVALPVTVAQATCQILKLDLGPLDLNLLGLRVQLSPVHLLITAVSGAGNLLGNLLCGIANLLNGGPLVRLGAVANFLNQLIRIFG